MSKIGVELARSVDEQQQALKMRDRVATTGKTDGTHSAMDLQGNGNEASNATAPAKEEARLSTIQSDRDKKLQEFLQVMQPPSKSRAWDDQDALAVAPMPPRVTERDLQKMPAADERSDGEYEPMRKKQKKSTEASKYLLDDGRPDQGLLSTDGEDRDQALENQVGGGVTLHSNLEAPPTASDEDWLRSRTSRLLGLVDDDRMLAAKSPKPAGENASNGVNEEILGLENEELSGGIVQNKKLTGVDEHVENREPSSADIEEPTAGNGRLYLRNLTYTTTENDIREYFEGHGYGGIEEVRKTSYIFLLQKVA